MAILMQLRDILGLSHLLLLIKVQSLVRIQHHIRVIMFIPLNTIFRYDCTITRLVELILSPCFVTYLILLFLLIEIEALGRIQPAFILLLNLISFIVQLGCHIIYGPVVPQNQVAVVHDVEPVVVDHIQDAHRLLLLQAFEFFLLVFEAPSVLQSISQGLLGGLVLLLGF